MRKDAAKVPEPTLRRLPWYLSNIKLMKERGERYVSSTQISKEINVDSSQIAKDLSYVNISGRTRVGYDIDALIRGLEDFLGFTNLHKAFLFGVGSLGQTQDRAGPRPKGANRRGRSVPHMNLMRACRSFVPYHRSQRARQGA